MQSVWSKTTDLPKQKELKGKNVPEKMSDMYYGIDEGGLSFRCAEGNLLLGGGSYRTGKKVCHCENKGYSYLREQAHLLYPQAEETAYWAYQRIV